MLIILQQMRLDKHIADNFPSRSKAAEAVAKGLVLVNGKVVSASYEVKEGDNIKILQPTENYVSAGGFKLSKALKDFNFDVTNKVIADIGASTGGFTDCLLQNGAKRVYCIDGGQSQLDKSLLCDRVTVIDNFNARNINENTLPERADAAVIDVSFISLTYILREVGNLIDEGGAIIALIKPQFECESKKVGKNGIVKAAETHKRIIAKICNYASSVRLAPANLTNAPIYKDKNKEYLVLLIKNGKNSDIKSLIESGKL